MPDNPPITLNGIDATTGQYLVAPLKVDEVAALASGEKKKKDIVTWLKNIWHVLSTPHLGLPLDVRPEMVEEAGWGIVFYRDEDPAVKAALQPLIEHRRQQIHNDKIVKVLEYRPNETWQEWLGRNGSAPGSVIPSQVPYYLLLVGSPEHIPFDLGQLLDVEYGVGWLHFDTPAEYGAYAASVIDYETSATVPNGREAVFFGTRHSFDQATKMSADFLVNPLVDGTPAAGLAPAEPGVAEQWGYRSRKLWGAGATRAALSDAVCGDPAQKPPAFMFTASHGMGFPAGHPDQVKGQGALLCQDWPGFGNISPAHYFAAANVPAEARVHGMVLFHFACFGAGTPQRDLFVHDPGKTPALIANQPFLAALPKAWLAHPKGGALACIGHVERAWGYSIVAPNAGVQIQTFQNAIGRILIGQPLGYALKDFNEKYASLSAQLSDMIEKQQWGNQADPLALATTWVERNDAEGYILVGDPAVKLRANDLV
jgi:hypothetical protein